MWRLYGMTKFYIMNVLILSVGSLVPAKVIYPGPGLREVPWIIPNAIGQQCWKNNIVPYMFTDTKSFPFREDQIAAIVRAVDTFNEFTCLKFVHVEETPLETKEYLVFNKTVEGWCRMSQLRNITSGVKYVVITVHSGCLRYRTEHMIMHALGFTHEHQRSDRNCYVNVHPEHVEHEKYKMMPQPRWEERYPYDKYSSMHYISNFRLHSKIVTAIPIHAYQISWRLSVYKDYEQPVGNELGSLTKLDLHKIKYKFCKGPHFCHQQLNHDLCRQANWFKVKNNCTPWSATNPENVLPPF